MKNSALRLGIDTLFALAGLAVGFTAVVVSEYYMLNRSHLGYTIIAACTAYLLVHAVGLRAAGLDSALISQFAQAKGQALPLEAKAGALIAILQSVPLLLILDNYEDVLEEGQAVSRTVEQKGAGEEARLLQSRLTDTRPPCSEPVSQRCMPRPSPSAASDPTRVFRPPLRRSNEWSAPLSRNAPGGRSTNSSR